MRMMPLLAGAIASALPLASALAQEADGLSNTPGCLPEVRTALIDTSRAGAEAAMWRVRNSYTRPPSVVGMSCLERLLNGANGTDILFDVNRLTQGIFQMLQDGICNAADQLWASSNSTSFDPSRFFRTGMPNIPGLSTVSTQGAGSVVIRPPTPGTGYYLPAMPGGSTGASSSGSPSLGNLFR